MELRLQSQRIGQPGIRFQRPDPARLHIVNRRDRDTGTRRQLGKGHPPPDSLAMNGQADGQRNPAHFLPDPESLRIRTQPRPGRHGRPGRPGRHSRHSRPGIVQIFGVTE